MEVCSFFPATQHGLHINLSLSGEKCICGKACLRGSRQIIPNKNIKKFSADQEKLGLKSSFYVRVSRENDDISTYAESRKAKDEQVDEKMSAQLFQEKREKSENVPFTELRKSFVQ